MTLTLKSATRQGTTTRLLRWIDRGLPLVGVVVLFGVWWLIAVSGWVNPVLLPTPWQTLGTLFSALVTGTMATDFFASVFRTFTAFSVAALVGVPLGVLLGSSEKLYRSVEFLIDFFRSTPASALIPMFILFFGISDSSKIIIAAFSAFLLIVFNSAYGVMNARRSRILAAKVMGANRWQVFKDVLLMESLPQTFIGLRSGISIALVIVIVAEMFIGTDQGLGKRIIDAQQILNVRDMYASILITGLLGYGLNVLFLAIEKRLIHWSGN
jgi:ABC-type nitrate/sulfonate/bicarbonate transport system permease component